MALTREEAKFVDDMESVVNGLKAEIGSSARRLIRDRVQVTAKQAEDPETYARLYGEGADDKLAAEIATIDTAIDALFATGFISKTREETEKEIEAGNMPPMP